MTIRAKTPVERLATALTMAEKAHAAYEKEFGKHEDWQTFYAQWMMDNIHIWSDVFAGTHNCSDGSCLLPRDPLFEDAANFRRQNPED